MSIKYETPQQLRYMLEMELYRLNGTYQIKRDAIPQLAQELSQDLFEAWDDANRRIRYQRRLQTSCRSGH
jgi:hypothetical protein